MLHVLAVGDTVNADDVVCEIETDKTAIPVPAPMSGVIVERFVEDGSTVQAGTKLFRITSEGGKLHSNCFPTQQSGFFSDELKVWLSQMNGTNPLVSKYVEILTLIVSFSLV